MLPVLAVALAALPQSPPSPPAAPPHWAYVAPVRPVVPHAADDRWSRDDLDRVVLARLRAEGLQPSPPADPATLLRRVHLVLTGLPPSPADLDAFLHDAAPDAYERRVDALLAAPACAEHMAAAWLDLGRFADTYGYQADFECRTWPWRDWLLDALARDLPYDRFASELVAGDLLPDATAATRLATAFFRLHRQTNEGGSIDEEWRQEYIADRVETFGTAFLGLTVGCARCHDHKADPIAQRDYHALGSFFSIDEAGLYPYTTGATPRPAMRLPTPAQERELADRRAAVAAAEQALAAARAAGAAGEAVVAAPPRVQLAFERLEGGRTADAARGDKPAGVAAGVVACEGPRGAAVQFDGDGGVTVPDVPPFARERELGLSFWLWCPDSKARAVVVHTSNYTEDADTQGYQVLLKDGRLCWEIVHHWPGAAIALQARQALPLQRWVHVAASYDGSSRARGLRLFVDGAPADTEVVRDQLDGPATVRTLQLGARDRDRGLAGGRLDEFALFDHGLDDVEVAALAAGQLLPPRPRAAAVVALQQALQQARAALHALEESIPEIMVLAAHPAPPPRFLLKRGAYDQPDRQQPVPADVPQAVLPFAAQWPRTRLGLAAWLTDPAHPLFARVQGNRLWAQCFGQGLVRTAENFGRLGEPPLQKDLLDLLACDFAAGGYRNRALLRRIVTSATFCQASAASAAARERDPDNQLLGRGPSFRLAAETLRDQALFASGLLAVRTGGPSVRPWQPPHLWRDAGVGWAGADYQPDTGEGAHRRSLYTFRKRTAPPPDLQTLDAPSRETCVARRQVTDTPLQALVFLDDPVFVECAAALAARVRQELPAAGPGERLARLFVHLAARPPRPAELAALQRLVDAPSAGADPLVLAASTLMASDAVVVLR